MNNNFMSTSSLISYLHTPKTWPNILVISYIFISYLGGIYMIYSSNIFYNFFGLFFTCHSLVYSVFFSHELLHGSVFKNIWLNKFVSIPIRWVTGMCYVPYSVASRGHIQHHMGNKKKSVRVMSSKVPMPALTNMPRLLFYSTIFLEWFYFPISTYLYLWWRNFLPFWTNQKIHIRLRVLLIFLSRLILFILLVHFSFKAAFLYFLAYNLMITIVRFNQAFEHTPNYLYDPESKTSFTTFSPLISKKYPWLDLLVLNFGYHNAHHVLMSCPWYHLPVLDNDIFQGQRKHHLSWRELLLNYHKFRINRMLPYNFSSINAHELVDLSKFYGVQAALPF